MILNGLKKSAILLMLLGSENTVKIFKYLKLYEIKKIITFTLDINVISKKDMNIILNDFMLEFREISKYIFLNQKRYIEDITKNVFHKKKSEIFLKKIFDKKKLFNKIQELQNIPDKNLFYLLQHEHAYIITAILFFLDSKYSSSVISYFTHKQQSEIIFLIANFSGLDESKIPELSEIVDIIVSEYQKISCKKKSLFTAINILNATNFNKSRKIIYDIFKYNQDLGEEILYLTLSFEDFSQFTDDSIIQLIRCIDQHQLTIALYYAKKEIKDKFFQHHQSLAENVTMLEMDKEQYLSYNIVKNAQELLVFTAKKLLKKKKISIVY